MISLRLKTRRFILMACNLVILILFTVSCSSLPISKEERGKINELISKAQNSKIILLDVFHNRCETCKNIEPVVEKLKEDYSLNSEVAFLKYDLSNPITIYKSKKIAKALGLEDIYKVQRYSGVVLVIDSMTKLVTDTLIAEYNIDKYKEIIRQKLSTVK